VRRILLLVAVSALVLGACSGGEDATPTTGDVGPSTTQDPGRGTTPGTDAEGATTTTATPGGTTTVSDRPLAPDFTLDLGDGGSYTLSEGAKPVYLVFWAEW
jgi:hypothetical protein